MATEPNRTVADGPLHEVFLELSSGTRVIVGRNLPDAATASDVANKWIRLARDEPDALHLAMPDGGTLVRGSAIVVIKAQLQPSQGLFKGVREGVWL